MGEASEPPVDNLESLARSRFGDLSEAELRLLRSAPMGDTAQCGPSADGGHPANDPAKADQWGSDREIRAELIRWLCVDSEPTKRIDPRGIRVRAAKVTGKLDLSFAIVPFPLRLFRCRLDKNADLTCAGIPLLNLDGTWTRSLTADGVNVAGSVFLRGGFTAEGEVRLLGARIGDTLDCNGGTFKNPGQNALHADRVRVTGGVFLSDGFTAEGEVRLLGAEIGRDLTCTGGTFSSLSAQTAVIKGNFFWRQVKNAESAQLDLTNASVGALVDGRTSWPTPGNLTLDGFTYTRIFAGPEDAPARLEWLARLDRFTLQPYRQLARVLRETGDDRGARRVLLEMEYRRRKEQERNSPARLWSWVLRVTIGYGQLPRRALGWLAALVAIGFVFSYFGYFNGAIRPTEKDAYSTFEQQGQPPPYYPRFHALAYSVEHSFPFVNLGQKDHWAPNPQGAARTAGTPPKSPEPSRHLRRVRIHPFNSAGFLRWWLWFQVLAGWVLATLFVAGLTGIVKSG